jgi:hypothetical protein
MPSIRLTDIKLRLFVDTNILIDAFTTPQSNVTTFLEQAKIHPEIDLITSDYALWEHHEFIRKQIWIKNLVNNNNSYKGALSYKIELTEEIRKEVENAIDIATKGREKFGIDNANLMDEETLNKDFFRWLELFQIHTRISNQDLLILLSAYATQSNAILGKDKNFKKEVGEDSFDSIEMSLQDAQIPEELKRVFFIGDLKTNPQKHYYNWFTKQFIESSIGHCYRTFKKRNVLVIESNEVEIGDYLMLIKFSDDTNEAKKIAFRIDEDCFGEFEPEKVLEHYAKKRFSIKLSQDIEVQSWMKNALIYKLDVS